mgnify:CR=1 FL=1
MATEKIGIEVEVKGAEKSISSFKDLKTAIKAAKDEQIAMTSKFGENSIEATKAGQKLAGLKDKVEDLNDSTKSLKGSGVEKLTSSFRLLGEGIGTFDFDKIKTGFKGVGAAMGAIPIFLLIEGIKLLYDNFETIAAMFDKTSLAEKALADVTKEVSGELSKVLEGVQNVESGFAAFHKGTITRDEALKIYNETLGGTLGTTNDLALAESNFVANKDLYIEAMQAKSTANVLFAKSAEAQAKVLTGEAAAADVVPWYEKTYAYVSSIGLNLQADMNEYSKKVVEYGNIHSKETQQFADDTKKLGQTELEKSDAIFNSLKTNGEKAGLVTKQNVNTNKKAAEDKFADEKKLLSDIEKAKEESYLRSLKSDEARAVAKAQFDNDKLIEDVNKSKAHQSVKDESLKQISIKLESDLLIIKNDFQGKRDAIEKTTAEKTAAQDKIDYAKRQSDADKAIAIIEEAERKKEQLEDAARERKLAKEKKLQQDILESVNIAAQTALSVQKTLSDTYYMKETQKVNKLYRDKLKNVVQGSKEEKAILEQKAKEEKDLARQQFETQKKFNRASAILNGILGLGAIFAVPDPTLGILSAIRAVALVATTAANVAQINATQFDEGGSSAGAIPAAADASPTTSQAPAIYGPGQGQSTTFSGNQNNNFAPVKAYVVETENRSTTNRVNKLVSESTYG